MEFHNTAKRLLCGSGHAVRFVKNDDFVSIRREIDVLLRKHLNFVAHHVDPSVKKETLR
jgi:hypothetical protein